MKSVNFKIAAILSVAMMIGSTNAGILSDIHKKFSNAGNKVEQKFELKKKYENTKTFIKRHKKTVIGASIITAVVAAGLIYKFAFNAQQPQLELEQPITQESLPQDDISQQTPANTGICLICGGPSVGTGCMHGYIIHTDWNPLSQTRG